MDFQMATPESVKRTMDGMDKPFIMLIETDNVYLDDYDASYNLGDLLIKLGEAMKRNGHSSSLIADPHGTVIGRYDWWR